MVWPFKWNLFSSTFTWYYFLLWSSNFWLCKWNPMGWPLNATSLAVFSHGAIHLVCSSNFWVCGPDPVQLPVVLTHSTIFAVSICSYNFGVWYHFSSTLSYNFWVLRWNPMAHYGSFKRNTLKWSFSIFSFCTSGTLWTDIFNNYSSSPSGLQDILTQRPRVREE